MGCSSSLFSSSSSGSAAASSSSASAAASSASSSSAAAFSTGAGASSWAEFCASSGHAAASLSDSTGSFASHSWENGFEPDSFSSQNPRKRTRPADWHWSFDEQFIQAVRILEGEDGRRSARHLMELHNRGRHIPLAAPPTRSAMPVMDYISVSSKPQFDSRYRVSNSFGLYCSCLVPEATAQNHSAARNLWHIPKGVERTIIIHNGDTHEEKQEAALKFADELGWETFILLACRRLMSVAPPRGRAGGLPGRPSQPTQT
eukprot:6023816-Pleurochrysis_carterae.AAC.1